MNARSPRRARIAATLASLENAARPLDIGVIASALAGVAGEGPLLVGVTGSVAVGKTTFCTAITRALDGGMRVEVISTDGFLLPNETLMERGLIMRKGFPESYDAELMTAVLTGARTGPVKAPGYSHVTYDRAPDLDLAIDRPDILLVEGLGLGTAVGQGLLDLVIYLDASESDLEGWFVTRFMGFWRAAEHDPASFYARFRAMSEPDAEAFARQVWGMINLPNLREHIAPLMPVAEIVISKVAITPCALSGQADQPAPQECDASTHCELQTKSLICR